MLGVAVCSHIEGRDALCSLCCNRQKCLTEGKSSWNFHPGENQAGLWCSGNPQSCQPPNPGHRVTGWLCPFATSWPSPAVIPHALQGEALPLCCLLLEQWVIWVSSPGQHTHNHLGT